MEKVLVPPRELKTLPEILPPGTFVLMRVDLNIQQQPLEGTLNDGGPLGRIARVVPDIKNMLQQKVVIALLTHWGDPHGKSTDVLSTRRLVPLLEKRLGKRVQFVPAVFGEQVRTALASARPGTVLLLENVRFWRAEEKDDSAFAKALAAPFSVYINNAFGASHRAHASLHAITRFVESYAGNALRREVTRFMKPVRSPIVCMIGGAKIETKVPLIERLGVHADTLLFGGGVALALQLAKGDDVPGASGAFRRKEVLGAARRILHRFEGKMLLPSDVVARPEEERVFDIGPETRARYARILKDAKTVVWNGPMGIVEDVQGQEGTRALAQALATTKAEVFVGGGETVAFLNDVKMRIPGWHVSSGGGAMLAFFAGERMPGLEPLWLA